MIDYTAVLADACRKYQALALVVEGLTRLIDAPPVPAEAVAPTALTAVAHRALKSGRKPQRAATKVHRTAAHSAASTKAKPVPKAGKTHRGKVAPADWERARKWWTEGVSGPEIGQRIGCSDAGVYFHARGHGWPKRSNAAIAQGATAAPPKPTAKGEKVPMRRCDSCQMTTERDPCHLCGTKWKRE